jgi:hypothetical protein
MFFIKIFTTPTKKTWSTSPPKIFSTICSLIMKKMHSKYVNYSLINYFIYRRHNMHKKFSVFSRLSATSVSLVCSLLKNHFIQNLKTGKTNKTLLSERIQRHCWSRMSERVRVCMMMMIMLNNTTHNIKQ